MTETSILPGASPDSDPGNAMVPPPLDVEEAAGDSRRRLMILGLIAAIVVIAGAAYLLLHKSSPSSDSSFTPPAPVPTAAPHTGSNGSGSTGSHSGGSGSGAKPGTVLPRKSHTKLVRDPFHPLVVAPVAGASSPGVSASQQPVSNQTVPPQPQSTSPTVVVTQPSTVTGGGTPPPSPGGQGTTGAPVWIRLVSVQGTHSATFDVGYAHNKFRRFKVISPSPTSSRGTVFDGEFALLGIQGSTATIQVGDDTPFDLTPKVAHSV